MSEDLGVKAGGVGEEVITLFAAREGSGSRSKSTSRSRSKSKDAGGGARATRAEAASEAGGDVGVTFTCKQLGEIAEAAFLAKAVGQGLVVAKPWGDSEPYDFIVNVRRQFNYWRVQVKSAHVMDGDGCCSFRAHDGEQRSYTAENIDALVAYAKPSEAWYVFPVRVVEGVKSLKLYPGSRGRKSKHEKWREAWEILRRVVQRKRRK